MDNRTYEDGYCDGWRTVAGDEPTPDSPTRPPEEEWHGKAPFQLGFEYGRSDALERFKPGL